MSVALIGGCKKCGMINAFPEIDQNRDLFGYDEKYPIICKYCIDKYYSKSAIREQNLKKILKNWWQFWK